MHAYASCSAIYSKPIGSLHSLVRDKEFTSMIHLIDITRMQECLLSDYQIEKYIANSENQDYNSLGNHIPWNF